MPTILEAHGEPFSQVARFRRVQVLTAQEPTRDGETWLQSASVSPCMCALYDRVWRMIRGFVDRLAEPPETKHDWDREMASLMDMFFFEGQAAACGERALAALS